MSGYIYHFRTVVQQFAGSSDLESFHLTESQWSLALKYVLAYSISKSMLSAIIVDQMNLPLSFRVIPSQRRYSRLEALRNVSNDTNVPSVIRVAAMGQMH